MAQERLVQKKLFECSRNKKVCESFVVFNPRRISDTIKKSLKVPAGLNMMKFCHHSRLPTGNGT